MVSYRVPGPLGGLIIEDIDEGTMCRAASPKPGPLGESIEYTDKNTISQSSSFRPGTLRTTLINLQFLTEFLTYLKQYQHLM